MNEYQFTEISENIKKSESKEITLKKYQMKLDAICERLEKIQKRGVKKGEMRSLNGAIKSSKAAQSFFKNLIFIK